MIKPPRCTRIPDEAQQLFMSTRKLSYRVFYFTVYRMGLRLNEGLNLKVGDIDTTRMRVHIRNAKGNKDRRPFAPRYFAGVTSILGAASAPHVDVPQSDASTI